MADQNNGTLGRVYGGANNLIHIRDGERDKVGKLLAFAYDDYARREAFMDGRRTHEEAAVQELCPGCYMVVGFNMLVELAHMSKQDLQELGRCMANAFTQLAETGEVTEEARQHIAVLLDKPSLEPEELGCG